LNDLRDLTAKAVLDQVLRHSAFAHVRLRSAKINQAKRGVLVTLGPRVLPDRILRFFQSFGSVRKQVALDHDWRKRSMPASGELGVSSPVTFQYIAQSDSDSSSGPQSLTSASTLESIKLDSPSGQAAKGLLRESEPFFDEQVDASEERSIRQMQKEDPLGTQIWRLYSKNKSQLPNAERMENLTWRMMSMNLRRKELAARQRSVMELR